jgi:hypothetical protein
MKGKLALGLLAAGIVAAGVALVKTGQGQKLLSRAQYEVDYRCLRQTDIA